MTTSTKQSFSLSATLIALLAMLCMAGCRSQKPDAATAGHTPAATATAPALPASEADRYETLCASYRPWTDVSLPVKIELKSPARLSASARAYMKRGEWVYMSVRMLGFEIATLWVDNDSVIAVDKFHKRYVSQSLSSLFGSGKVSLLDIQDLLTGRAFLAPEGTATPSMRRQFSITDNGADSWLLIPEKETDGFSYGFLVSTPDNTLLATQVEVGSHAATIMYASPVTTPDAGAFCKSVNLTTSTPKGTSLEAALTWDFSSAKWNSGEERAPKVPSGYTRISASSLLKTLGNL